MHLIPLRAGRSTAASVLSKLLDECGDFAPRIPGDYRFTFLDLARVEIHVCRISVHRHRESGCVGMSLRAARSTVDRLEVDTGTFEFFPYVSRDLQLAFLERGQSQRVLLLLVEQCSRYYMNIPATKPRRGGPIMSIQLRTGTD